MTFDDKVNAINKVLANYFAANNAKVKALELMPLFVEAGIFTKDCIRQGKPIRDLLRTLDGKNQLQRIPYVIPEKKNSNTSWFFAPLKDGAQYQTYDVCPLVKETSHVAKHSNGRSASDEHYVIDLCDEVLGLKASRQHGFDFLKGDTGRRLPVDAYYEEIGLVVEYCESQHSESTPFFDKKMTVSGVSRGEQRRIYDKRRSDILPKYGLRLVIIDYKDFGTSRKLKRDKITDIEIVKRLLGVG